MDHPQFVSRCLEAAVPPNLGHCLRLMRVIELEAAAPPPPPSGDDEGQVEGISGGGGEEKAISKPVTFDATARIARVLVKVSKVKEIIIILTLTVKTIMSPVVLMSCVSRPHLYYSSAKKML